MGMVTLPMYRGLQTNEYFRLTQKDLMQCARLKVGEKQGFRGTRYGDHSVSLLATRKEASLDIRDRKERSHFEVPLLATQLTYGWRWWVACPRCKRRCALLYYSVFPLYGLLCRHCVKPKYETQNAGERLLEAYLDAKYDELFERLWPGSVRDYDFYGCDNPKPCNRWYRTFAEDLYRLEGVEEKLSAIWEGQNDRFLISAMNVLQKAGYDPLTFMDR